MKQKRDKQQRKSMKLKASAFKRSIKWIKLGGLLKRKRKK